ncbi:MAG: hypothetical protein WA941_23625 [Nitrososphaeraceae archaeon]
MTYDYPSRVDIIRDVCARDPDTVADENQRRSTFSEQGNIMILLATRQILTHEEPKKLTKQGKPGTPTVLIRKTINTLATGVSRILKLYARLSATWDHFSSKIRAARFA